MKTIRPTLTDEQLDLILSVEEVLRSDLEKVVIQAKEANRLRAPRTEAGPSIEAINSARYVMYNARDFGEHEAILANEIMRLDVNASRSETGSIEPQE